MQIKSDMLDLTWCMIAFTLNELSIQTFKLLLYCKVNNSSKRCLSRLLAPHGIMGENRLLYKRFHHKLHEVNHHHSV